jgi:hypothetical protein
MPTAKQGMLRSRLKRKKDEVEEDGCVQQHDPRRNVLMAEQNSPRELDDQHAVEQRQITLPRDWRMPGRSAE